jgi:alkylated DNA repair dioxygenase AlkB
MEFRNTKTFEKKRLLLEPRSLLIMTGEARYKWTHGIPKADTDEWNGKLIPRSRRVSLTYRTIVKEYITEVFLIYIRI